ncbi:MULTISPECIES: Ig-like domain-containing protein [Haloarcula]|uniref:Ig-like domain-containing protein n=1 Tax=Haloarcula TaxID=2237 RepID=UPI0023EC27F7|nr:Ig-like domain-containing protein [Halomicroarcula sp. XH51]
MSTTTQRTRLGALVMAVVVTTAVLAATVTFSASASAAVNTGTLEVTDDPVQPDGSIEVTGDLDSESAVTFLIQDPDDNDYATVTRTGLSGTFTETIDLSNLDFGDGLDDGEATISADTGSEFNSKNADSTTFVVDDEYPTVSIDAPDGGAELTDLSDATIEGTASDDSGLKSVEIAIQRSNGDYYRGSSSWGDKKFLSVATEAGDWSYDMESNGITGDDSYTVTVRATDEAGNTRTGSSGPPVPSGDTLQVEYTVDTTAPDLTDSDVTVTEKGADDTVSVGDTVKVSATVTDATAGVESVEVDASALGGSETLSLSKQDGDTYYDSFTVQSPTASDGSVSLDVKATDEFGNTASGSDSVTLETEISSVETLTVDHNFVGIVDDTDSVRVTATGVEDPQGNAIASGDASTETATLEIAGTSYSVDVDGGEIDATIDPTKIPDDTATGEATVSIAEADSQPPTDVTLVHEARGLDGGYQLAGTPMDAQDVVFQDVSDVTTYDPTAENTKWISPDEQQAGSGYYVHGESSDARVGYTFEESGELRSEKLHEGYNLVAATPDLNVNDGAQIGSDLGDGVTVDGNADVTVYVRDESVDLTDPSGNADTSAFTEVSGTTTVDGFDGYFVYVDSGEEIRTVDDEGYDASEGS